MHSQEDEEPKRRIVAVSGGFDPLHIGHIRYIQDAARYGDVVVLLNTDEWLLRKKRYVFMPWEQRLEILQAIKGVSAVIKANDSDGTVCQSLETLQPDFFAKGGDRTVTNTPEQETCKRLGISILWNCGGGKIVSSQGLVDALRA